MMTHVNIRTLGESRVALRLQKGLYPISTVDRMLSVPKFLVPADQCACGSLCPQI